MPPENGCELLQIENISKHFGAVEALSRLDLTITAGSVCGLMGDNGAGKSTLLKIISGNHRPSEGRLLICGEEVQFHAPSQARAAGIEVVHQDLALCDNLSASANVFLGRELVRKVGPLCFLDHSQMLDRTRELMQQLESETPAEGLVRNLSGGQRQAVAIARALLSKARLVLLDEPTASISVRQVTNVLRLIKNLKAQGVAVVLVSHRMPDVFAVCDRIAVLRRGRKVCDKPASATSPEEVTALITGALDAA